MSVSMAQLWENYLQSLNKNPIPTKMATSVVLTYVANAVTQKLTSTGGKGMDHAKALRFCAFSVCLTPLSHVWYKFLDIAFPKKDDAKPAVGLDKYIDTNVLKKLAMDELIYDPFCLIFFFSFIGLLEGKSRAQIADTIKSQYWVTQKASWRLWPVAQLLNFQFVPGQLRLPFMNLVSFFWSIFLQMRASQTPQIKSD